MKNIPKEWWFGPPIDVLPSPISNSTNTSVVAMDNSVLNLQAIMPNISNCKDDIHAVRVLALVILWVNRVVKKLNSRKVRKIKVEITLNSKCNVNSLSDTRKIARNMFIQNEQRKYFADDLDRLYNGKFVLLSSKLNNLNPSFDHEREIIVVNTRTKEKLPLLPSESEFFILVVLRCHRRVFHMGVDATFGELMRNVHAIKSRQVIRRIINTKAEKSSIPNMRS